MEANPQETDLRLHIDHDVDAQHSLPSFQGKPYCQRSSRTACPSNLPTLLAHISHAQNAAVKHADVQRFNDCRVGVQPVHEAATAGSERCSQPTITASQVHDQTARETRILPDFPGQISGRQVGCAGRTGNYAGHRGQEQYAAST